MPSQAGKPGYRVLTPFRRDDSDTLLLVDRGWVPLGASRSVLPPVFVSPGHRAVSGRLDDAAGTRRPGRRRAGVPGDRSWPRVLNFPRQQDVEQALGERVESRIVLLDPAAPDGYERAWRPAMRFGPERHLGYAIQWFALALAVLVAFVALSLRRRDDAADTADDGFHDHECTPRQTCGNGAAGASCCCSPRSSSCRSPSRSGSITADRAGGRSAAPTRAT